MILREASHIFPVILNESNGKAHALNEAVKNATGEILVFLDTRQLIEPDAISELVSCFADSTVGAVSGELLLESSSKAPAQDGLGIYWKIEKAMRKLESASGSVVGVTGAIYAIRRELYTEIPAGTILDDVFVPMHIARMGKRVVFQPLAIARDRLFIGPIAFDSHAGGFRIIQRAVLSSGLLAADPVLCFGRLRNLESVHQKV